FDAALDEARALRDDSRAVLAKLETRYASETGVRGLKVRHNNLLGYFLEATTANAQPLMTAPFNETFHHRQSMANAVRFVTDELAEIEGRIASAGARALSREQELFNDLAEAIRAEEPVLGALAAALAELDCIAALAELARAHNYVRPDVTDAEGLSIIGGRHPVVEQAAGSAEMAAFIANDCLLGDDGTGEARPPGFEEIAQARIWLVTGPNMAGKSTYLRQTALIVLLAQAGSFVPARSARIGLVDRIFSRVGASDDLARGRSTFMVEMIETAAILNQATDRSLVILDEVGRGTATFDGLSIAWAAVEHLHDEIGCRALFATHYHEMTALAGRLPNVANVTMAVREWRDEIVFLHQVRPGAANRSYGIQVARLAGLPDAVIARAGEVLKTLEAHDMKSATAGGALDDLPLFEAARPKSMVAEDHLPSELEAKLDDIRPDELSPRAALDLIYALKALARDGGAG
ncbi:MAG: DNA mismatch repair protein MutS, partial [Pseudomonadota bacterium]